MSEDLFDGRPDSNGSETALKLDKPGAIIQIKVTDISDQFETDHGEGFVVSGDLEVKRGEVSGDPEVNEEGSFFISALKKNGDEHHLGQELRRALKRVGARELSVGDTLAIKFVEERPSKTKGYAPFKKYAMVVKRGSTELQFTDSEDSPF